MTLTTPKAEPQSSTGFKKTVAGDSFMKAKQFLARWMVVLLLWGGECPRW